jgi:hypothetical protein
VPQLIEKAPVAEMFEFGVNENQVDGQGTLRDTGMESRREEICGGLVGPR